MIDRPVVQQTRIFQYPQLVVKAYHWSHWGTFTIIGRPIQHGQMRGLRQDSMNAVIVDVVMLLLIMEIMNFSGQI